MRSERKDEKKRQRSRSVLLVCSLTKAKISKKRRIHVTRERHQGPTGNGMPGIQENVTKQANKALQPTAQPLRGFTSAELGR